MKLESSEVLFIDPAVSDVQTLLAELRPGVEAVLLDAARPAAQQMAEALVGRRDLAAVHIIAHGAPGRVGFAAGEWSLETLARDAGDLAAIGRVLAEDGDLRQPRWEEEGWAITAKVGELLELYQDFHPSVLAMIGAIQPETLFKWGLRDRDPLEQWTLGRVSTLGDAAHPTSPLSWPGRGHGDRRWDGARTMLCTGHLSRGRVAALRTGAQAPCQYCANPISRTRERVAKLQS